MEEIKQPETTTTTAPVEPDLVTKVAQHKIEPPVEVSVKEPEFDFKEIEKIQDPVAKDYAMKAYKSFQKGFNQKFQEIADIRKTLEAKTQEAWTPERVNGLLKDPQFVNAAKQVAESSAPTGFEGTQEQWSALSDTDKVKFQQLEQKINLLERQNSQALKMQQDEQLKTKFQNYNPEAVDILTSDLLAGKVQATREHLWKVYDYEEAIKRAYDLGKKDGKGEIGEKKGASTIDSMNVTVSGESPKPEQGESNRAFWRRLVDANISKLKK